MGAGSAVGTWNPGTYYNVKLYPAAGAGVAHAAVTIKASGIAKVEITAGGLLAEADGGGTKGVYHIKCDTRLASGLTDTSANNAACATPGANNIIVVTLGDSTTAAKTNILQASLVVGSVPSAIDDAQDDCATSQAVTSQGSSFLLAGNAAGGGTSMTHLITGVKLNIGCGAGAAATTVGGTVVVAGGSTDADGTLPTTVALLQTTAVKVETGTNENTFTFSKAQLNAFYYTAGFYDTTTPKFFRDGLHEGLLQGGNSLDHQKMTIMGGRTGMVTTSKSLLHPAVSTAVRCLGILIMVLTAQATVVWPLPTARPSSVVAGAQGDGATVTPGLDTIFMEWMPKYSYVGLGFDQLTVTPAL